ncbi:PepSY domain-containing protein [Pseudoalteromonas sp. S3785]|uniref:PepSY domain-containing protein n=1 Tax=Pseudoalteromonas sp. S3785 TaxID=579545 RepID=UPI0024C25223|nr:PepSY domain-containing protein [Pseudoalteromonas sp. S3785]
MLAIPKQTDPLITALLGNIDKSNSATVKSKNSISSSAALSTAQKAMPNTRLTWVEPPSNHNAVCRFRFKTKSDPSYRFPHSFVQVNANTGELISVFNIDKMSVASKFKKWLHPPHNGSIGDQPLRILWV